MSRKAAASVKFTRTLADRDAFCEFMRRCEQAPEVADVAIPEVSLTSFDQLLSAVGGVQ